MNHKQRAVAGTSFSSADYRQILTANNIINCGLLSKTNKRLPYMALCS